MKNEKDIAIRKALKLSESIDISDEFNINVMNKVLQISANKKRREIFLTYFLLILASGGLVSLAVYFLKDIFSIRSFSHYFEILLLPESISIVLFSFYISILIVLLMVFDAYFRNLRQKHLNKSK